MLKILADGPSDQDVMLRLDGQVAGRWVDVLRKSCELALNRRARLTLEFDQDWERHEKDNSLVS